MAAQIASPKKEKVQKDKSEALGNPTNTGAVRRTEIAHDQMRRGRGRLASTTPTVITKATSALNGKTRMTEKSTR